MGTVALVLGIIGVLLSLVPWFTVSQMVGVVVGLAALTLGIRARRRALRQGSPPRQATAGIALGLVAMMMGTVVFASCQGCRYWLSRDERVKRGVQEARQEFHRAMEKALQNTRPDVHPVDGGAGR